MWSFSYLKKGLKKSFAFLLFNMKFKRKTAGKLMIIHAAPSLYFIISVTFSLNFLFHVYSVFTFLYFQFFTSVEVENCSHWINFRIHVTWIFQNTEKLQNHVRNQQIVTKTSKKSVNWQFTVGMAKKLPWKLQC